MYDNLTEYMLIFIYLTSINFYSFRYFYIFNNKYRNMELNIKILIFGFFFFLMEICFSQSIGCEFTLVDGDTDTHLSHILTTIDQNNCVSAKILVKGKVIISETHVLKNTIDLMFDNGGAFTGNGTLTLNCSIQAGLFKIFDINGLNGSLNLNGSSSTDRVFPQWFGAKINDDISDSNAINAAIKFAFQSGGGTVFFPSGKYIITKSIDMKSNILLIGEGDSSILENIGINNTINAIGEESNRIHGIGFQNLKIQGKDKINYSGKTGIYIRYSFNNEFDDNSSDYRSQRGDAITIFDVTISNHKEQGIHFNDGSLLIISNSTIENNNGYGIYVVELSNHLEVNNSAVSNNRKSGIYLNQVASNGTILGTQFTRNSEYGVVLQRCEQPIISYSSFNNNFQGAINIVGAEEKFVESPLIIGNLFGGNGIYNLGNVYEINMNYTKGATVISNYFYGVPYIQTLAMINIGKNVEGCVITNNHWKHLNLNSKKINFLSGSYPSQRIIFEDNNRTDEKWGIYMRNKYIEYINENKEVVVFQTKLASTNEFAPPNFVLKNGGEMNWGGGGLPVDITLKRISPDLLNISSHLQTKTYGLQPINSSQIVNSSTYGTIFLDSGDEKLKIKLPNGSIKVIKFE